MFYCLNQRIIKLESEIHVSTIVTHILKLIKLSHDPQPLKWFSPRHYWYGFKTLQSYEIAEGDEVFTALEI